MNGKDGKPFKTRDGGVMRLEYLLKEIDDEMLNKIKENQKEKENLNIDEAEAEQTAKTVALAAVKYGDLSNQRARITSLISTDSHPLRVTQVHISFIQSCVSSQYSQSMRQRVATSAH